MFDTILCVAVCCFPYCMHLQLARALDDRRFNQRDHPMGVNQGSTGPERPSSSGKTVGKQRFLEPNLLRIRATLLVIAPKPSILSGFSGSAAQK